MFEKEKQEFFERGGCIKLQNVVYDDKTEESSEVDQFLVDFTNVHKVIQGLKDARYIRERGDILER